MIIGVGLDGQDGQFRLTRGENFHLVGGSEDTHEQMTDACVKLNERLAATGRTLADLDSDQLAELAAEFDMDLVDDAPIGRDPGPR